ncbi:MAG: decarboxylase [archaeon]|nr:decarboxylase [archaeon]
MKPKFIISKSVVLNQYKTIEPLADIITYSSKTNPLITPILEENTNCLFSIHLFNELINVKDKSRVLFLAQAWDNEQIDKLIQEEIRYFVVDNEEDLNVLLEYLEKNNTQITLFLRLKLRENTIKTEKYFVFGMNSDVVNKRIPELAKNPKIKELGVHFHRKTQNMSEWNYQYEISNILNEETLSNLTWINMGGGLPAEYANTNVNIFDGIFTKIKEFKQWLQTKNIKLIIEPGRFIAAPAGKLHTKIISIYENNIIINASVYNSDMDALIVPVKLLIEGEIIENKSEMGKPYVIKGMTPCSLDLFRYRVYLNNPKKGNEIVFLNAGAYNFSTDFCNLDKIETEIVE